MADLIDQLVGIQPGSTLDALRAKRSEARRHAQASHDSLLEPKDPAGVTHGERNAIAAFVAELHGEPRTVAFYAARLPADLRGAVAAEAATARMNGPYGRFPKGPLSVEDRPGPFWKVGDASRTILGPRLAAALEHAHLLVFHPRDASAASLQALLDVGWSTTDIVTISQLVSFLTYQIRVVAGLSVLASTI